MKIDLPYLFLCMIFSGIMGLFYSFLLFSDLLREQLMGVSMFFVFTIGFYSMGKDLKENRRVGNEKEDNS